MTVAPVTPMWEEVAELDGVASRARDRLAALEAERSRAPRKLAAARGALAAYDESVGAGELEVDPELEAKLENEVRELGAR